MNFRSNRKLVPVPEDDIRDYGPKISSRQFFYEQATSIYAETGVDAFMGQSPFDLHGLPKHDWAVRPKVKRVHAVMRRASIDGTWETVEAPCDGAQAVSRFDRRMADGEVVELCATLDMPYSHVVKLSEELTDDELLEKRRYQAMVARSSKTEYFEDGTTDAPRFGFCKRKGCRNRFEQRLVIRSLCPDCLKKPEEAPAMTSTVAERKQRVLAAKASKPNASLRELARLTGLSKDAVHRLLKNDQKTVAVLT